MSSYDFWDIYWRVFCFGSVCFPLPIGIVWLWSYRKRHDLGLPDWLSGILAQGIISGHKIDHAKASEEDYAFIIVATLFFGAILACIITFFIIISAAPLPTETPFPIITTTRQPTITYTEIPARQVTPTLLALSITPSNAPSKTPRPTSTKSSTSVPSAGAIEGIRLPSGQQVTMIYIPSGNFIMGSDKNSADSDESPEHLVSVNGYWIDLIEVSNSQFSAFLTDTSYSWRPHAFSTIEQQGYGNYPIDGVSWYDANAFCEWRNARLPTEAEWEKAARGTDGRDYPWGNVYDDSKVNNASGDNYSGYAPVGSFSPEGDSPYGLQDMAGNVWEWTSSKYLGYPYIDNTARNPESPNSTELMTVRGGSMVDGIGHVRTSSRWRYQADSRQRWAGFRCVKD